MLINILGSCLYLSKGQEIDAFPLFSVCLYTVLIVLYLDFVYNSQLIKMFFLNLKNLGSNIIETKWK